MYSLFRELPNEQQMYQAIAAVGNILLKLGEFGEEHGATTPVDINAPKNVSDSNDFEKSSESRSLPEGVTTSSELAASTALPKDSNIVNSYDSEKSSESASLPEGVTASSELASSALLKEVLADAAQSSESSLSSPVRSTTGDDYVLVQNDDGFSSPENLDVDRDEVSENLSNLYLKLENTKITSASASSTSENPGDISASGYNVNIPGLGDVSAVFEPDAGSSEAELQDLDGRQSPGVIDSHWSISFEQFLASMLTEPYLVNYFEQQIDVLERLKRLKTEGINSFKASNNRLADE